MVHESAFCALLKVQIKKSVHSHSGVYTLLIYSINIELSIAKAKGAE